MKVQRYISIKIFQLINLKEENALTVKGGRIMHEDCKKVRDIVSLWYETQMGNIHKCKEKQFEFAEMMWELYNNKDKIKEKQTMGRAIDMENTLQALEMRLKLVEDALEELVQTRVHHVDLVKDVTEVEPDEVFTPPTGKRKKTTRTKTATVG
tara:strand:- start:100 stop:558 length:459 start_codon:yes stop_codon:yes gene_type:complete